MQPLLTPPISQPSQPPPISQLSPPPLISQSSPPPPSSQPPPPVVHSSHPRRHASRENQRYWTVNVLGIFQVVFLFVFVIKPSFVKYVVARLSPFITNSMLS